MAVLHVDEQPVESGPAHDLGADRAAQTEPGAGGRAALAEGPLDVVGLHPVHSFSPRWADRTLDTCAASVEYIGHYARASLRLSLLRCSRPGPAAKAARGSGPPPPPASRGD